MVVLIVTLIVVILSYPLIMLCRNELVLKARLKAIDISYRKIGNWEVYNNSDSYDEMLYSFSKWKFKHFYPELEEYL